MIKTKITKLIFGGQGLGRIDGRAAMIWNALPGEEVAVKITKDKRSYCEGIATQILTPAADRIAPRDHHFAACSPWQIMKPATENHWKLEIGREIYQRFGGIESWSELQIISAEDFFYNYRHKMEFVFAEDDHGQLSFAHSQRDSHQAEPLTECSLLSPAAGKTSQAVMDWIRQQQIPRRELKSLLVRSNQKGETIAALFLKKPREFISFPALNDHWLGFHIFYSSPLSPASHISREIGHSGQDYLEESIGPKKFRYGLSCFFQINPPLFQSAVSDAARFIPAQGKLIDFYAGVGAIGLSLQTANQPLDLIESFPEAVAYAKQNIALNHSANIRTIIGAAENALDYITPDSTVIFDPPRAGLHPKIIPKILAVSPSKIIYLSCNLATQARDLKLLLTRYHLDFLRLYNFFPRTPHIEGLAILTRNN